MERHWHIKNCRLFQKLPGEQLARLERRARLREFPKRSPVYLPSEPENNVFLLAEGRVKLCAITSEGKETILAFVEPGELFGELALFGESLRDEYAETILPSTVVLLPKDELDGLMAESAELTLGITKLIGLRRKRIERRLSTLLFRSNRERLIYLLLDLTEQYGRATSDGVHLSIRLSHQDMASIIGVTRESVTNLLGELRSEGLLTIARQRVVIKDLSRLAECVDSVAPHLTHEKGPGSISHPSKLSLDK